MIQLDEEKLQNVLKEVIIKYYHYNGNPDNFYLKLINVEFECYPDGRCDDYMVKGYYGYDSEEDKERCFNKSFDVLLNTEWSWDFLAGYFLGSITEREIYEEIRLEEKQEREQD